MENRRKFISQLGLATGLLMAGLSSCKSNQKEESSSLNSKINGSIVLSTWNNKAANAQAWTRLTKGESALDAIEKGIRITEANPDDTSVGIGGAPDRTGRVTLDACIMDASGNAGSVSFIEDYKHPISIARKVMEESPHVMLAGSGAASFAERQGFKKENLLTPASDQAFKNWKKKAEYAPKINAELHDTIGMIAMDQQGNLSGGCSTSGLAYKMRGRVGDSPVIGAGLFVDNEIGAATATGLGELVLKTLGSFLVVELMRQGLSPTEACKAAVKRIADKYEVDKAQVGFIAISKTGDYGGYAIQPGFQYILNNNEGVQLITSKSLL